MFGHTGFGRCGLYLARFYKTHVFDTVLDGLDGKEALMLTKILNRKTPSFDPFREPTAEELEAEQRQQAIDEAIEQRTKELRRAQHGTPLDERLSDKECRAQAEQEVCASIRQRERAERARRIRADVSSVYTRNKELFQPWFAGAAYAGTGEAASLLAATDVLTGLGPGAAAAVGAGATSWVTWRRVKELPEKYWSRFRAGIAAGCATCLSLPLAPWEWHGGILFGGAVALVAASAKYWSDHAPSYPPQGGYETTDEEPSETPSGEATVPVEAGHIIADWNQYVRDARIMPGAELVRPVKFTHGWTFTVKLARGKQRFDQFQKVLPDIAYALNMPLQSVHADPNEDPEKPLEPTLTISTIKPDTVYRGPEIVFENGSVFIELGRYLDGRGTVRYEILSDQLSDVEMAQGAKPRGSAVGGFALGDKGSGKTRLLEVIALAAKALGIEVWYLDPQGGASSPILRDNASWPLMGLDSPDGTRAFGNVEDLLTALEGVVAVRQDENAALGYTGFQHTRERPMILTIIDECHLVFGQYGHRFGDIDRIARKLGLAFLGASQAPTQDVFGGSITLRNGMAGANGFVLKYNGSNARLAFGGLDDEIARGCQCLPINRGHGYAVNGARPHAVFQNRYTPDLEPFFAQVGETVLDELATIGAGEAYAQRHATAEQNREAVQERLNQYRNGTLKPGQRPKNTSKPGGASRGPAASSSNGSEGNTVYLFPGTQPRQQKPQEPQVRRESLTARQLQILNMLTEQRLNAKQLATELGKTARTISTDLKFLREHKFVRVVDEQEGTYTASDNL